MPRAEFSPPATTYAAGGWLLLEHGYDQAAAVRELLARHDFEQIESRDDFAGHQRITLGRLPC